MSKPRISYIDPSTAKDAAMLAEFERCARGAMAPGFDTEEALKRSRQAAE